MGTYCFLNSKLFCNFNVVIQPHKNKPMPFYHDIDPSTTDGKRTVEKILDLRLHLRDKIPERKQSRNLLLATWNIRDFDKPSHGPRLDESFYYMAEIIDSFDLVAIQEVYRDLRALKKLMSILGGHWKYVFSDATEGRQGNDERIAYVYDTRKVRFGGLAGELVIPPVEEKIKENGKNKTIYHPVGQIWRTPLICGFQAGWARFMLCNVHIQWGQSTANSEARVQEIKHVADFLKKRTEDPTAWARKLILLGDFNIFDRKDKTYDALEKAGFKYPPQLKKIYSNIGKDKQYDQILLRERENRFEILDSGTFDFFEIVFKETEENLYESMMMKKDGKERYKSYKMWRTHQLSDHMPIWVELRIDYADEYLKGLLE